MRSQNYLIIGAGFSGAVIAEQLSKNIDCSITVLDERNHIGGNCHTERDGATGIMVHTYGPHIFNTDNKEVWDYINRFGNFKNYTHRVKAIYQDKVYTLPINLHTINQFFGKNFTPAEAEAFIASRVVKIAEPANFEEQAMTMIGADLYKAFMYGYTKKQWGCEPKELPASIIKRLPLRFNYNDSYYHGQFFGIPEEGYSAIIEKMLTHDNIEIRLNTRFNSAFDTGAYDHIFYTGPIDAYFDYCYGRLGYRTVTFDRNEAEGDFQGASQINYCDEDVSHTRVVEYKHFTPWEEHDQTVYFKEYSKETGDDDVPYYPKRLTADMDKLSLYQAQVAQLDKVTFLGRLATYRYMDMHHVIAEALQLAAKFIEKHK
ncbi:UDP-galactopyranose mutase [Mucilaginibacter calamicampi]|uniref:UDP-galactopyranose mutase n=1 Tax=Mucilaginibacter calamicampi TaxID=1302352 RepID=A0ABW2YXF2_9SPHI